MPEQSQREVFTNLNGHPVPAVVDDGGDEAAAVGGPEGGVG